MKKIKHIVASLLASSLLLAGCGKEAPCEHNDADNNHLCDVCGEKVSECADTNNDHLCDVCGEKVSECADADNDHLCDVCGEKVSEHKDDNGDHNCDVCGEALPYVASVTISEAPETICAGTSITLTATVDAKNGAENTVTWSANNASVELTANGNTVTVKGTGSGPVTITAKSTADETVVDTVSLEVLNWTDEELSMMETYLGEIVPFFEGSFVWTDGYFDDYACLTAESEVAEDVETAAAGLTAAGWTVVGSNGSYNFYYVSESTDSLVLTGQIYYSYGLVSVDVYVEFYEYDSWPEEEINEFLAFEDENPEEVPEIEGARFALGEDDYGGLEVTVLNPELNLINYYNSLVGAGWTGSTQYYSSYGVLIAQSPRQSIELDIYVNYGSVTVYKMGEPIPLYTEWPAADIATAQTGLANETIPAADGTEFILKVNAPGSFYFLSVTTFGGDLETYLDSLVTAGFSVIFDDYYECYTAIKNDLALDIYEYNNGSFDIMAYQHLLEWTEAQTDLMEELIGEELVFFSGILSWYDYYGMLEGAIESESAIAGICEALVADGWTGGLDETTGEYVYTKDSTVNEGNELTAVIYDYFGSYYIDVTVELPEPPAIVEWPAEELATILGNKTTETVPAYVGEGASFEIYPSSISANKANVVITNGDYDTYKAILVNAGYTVSNESTGYGEFLSPGKTIFIYVSQDSATVLTLTIKAQDAPAEEAEFPVDAVTAALGGEKNYPIPTGTSFSTSNPYGESDVVIEITGGDKATYIQALLDAGFVEDAGSSYPGSYVGYVDPNSEFVIYVWEAGTNTDFTIEFGPYYSW